MPAAIDTYWRERVKAIVVNKRRLGPGAIEEMLEAEAFEMGRADSPRRRWIATQRAAILAEGQDSWQPYREMRWPDSFLDGSLPWEAGGLALSLVMQQMKRSGPTAGRPLIRNVEWARRIAFAADPQAPIEDIWRAACYMAAWESNPEDNASIPLEIEAWLLRSGDLALLNVSSGGSHESLEALYGSALGPGYRSAGEEGNQ